MFGTEVKESRIKLILNVIVFIIALISVTQKKYTKEDLSPFDRGLISITGPIQSSFEAFRNDMSGFYHHYLFNVTASQENMNLRKKVSELNTQIYGFSQIALENERLKNLFNFSEGIKGGKVLAQIVALDASGDFKVIRINKGTKQGLKLLSPVVTHEGMVGYIYRLAENYADVMTIIDPNNKIDGIVARTRSHGIIEGIGNGKAMMKYVNRSESIEIGDDVISAGLGLIYPKGIKIGRVTKIERETVGITQYIEIEPSVSFTQLEEVIVLISPQDFATEDEWKKLDNEAKAEVDQTKVSKPSKGKTNEH